MEYTLSILKPDAVERNLVSKINKILEGKGLKIVAQKEMLLTNEQASAFYKEHEQRPFYGELVEYISSGPIVVQVLAGDDAINLYRQVMGATNPAQADPGTIRAEFAESISRNTVHGSDSLISAKREIGFFFDYDTITAH